nr:MAG TPA: hypothetical protein [Caudoviricetes sp.]
MRSSSFLARGEFHAPTPRASATLSGYLFRLSTAPFRANINAHTMFCVGRSYADRSPYHQGLRLLCFFTLLSLHRLSETIYTLASLLRDLETSFICVFLNHNAKVISIFETCKQKTNKYYCFGFC